jgi:hypothetical protein
MLAPAVIAPAAVLAVLGIAALLYLMMRPGSSRAPAVEQTSAAAGPTEHALNATAQSGVKTLVSEHVAFDGSCQPQHVLVKVTSPPANGAVLVREENSILPEKTTLGGVQKCAGTPAPTAVLYYTSKPNFLGTDQFRYERNNENNPNDRLNGHIILTVVVREGRTAKAIFEKHNLLGKFAWECSKPVARNNMHYVHRVLDGERVQREQMSGSGNRDWAAVFDKGLDTSPSELTLSGMITGRVGGRDYDNKPTSGIWRIERNRFVQWDATIDGQNVIAGGHFGNPPVPLPWNNRCGD